MVARKKSKAIVKVGAALVNQEDFVILTAYNGVVRGAHDDDYRYRTPLKTLYIVHAEQNIIATAAQMGIKTEGCSIVVTHMPCPRCTNLAIAAGIKGLYYGPMNYGKKNEFAGVTYMLYHIVTGKQIGRAHV